MSGEGGSERQRKQKEYSRRDFLRVGLLAMGAAVTGTTAYTVISNAWRERREATSNANALRALEEHLLQECNIYVQYGPEQNDQIVLGELPSTAEALETLRHLAQEVAQYPPDFFRNLYSGKPLQLRLIKNLVEKKNDREIPASGISGSFGELSLRTGSTEGWRTGTFHHEFLHQFEQKFVIDKVEHNRKWSELSPDYRYTGDQKDKVYNYQRNPRAPFLADYARTGPGEDRALFAEWMMDPPAHAVLVALIEGYDRAIPPPVRDMLRDKYKAMKQYYFEWSNGTINEEFWRLRIQRLGVTSPRYKRYMRALAQSHPSQSDIDILNNKP